MEHAKQGQKKVLDFLNKLNKSKSWLIPLVLILFVMSVSMYYRTYANDLPITDDWASGSVMNMYKNQIASQVNQQYPSLPDVNKEKLIDEKFQDYLNQNQKEVEKQISDYSSSIKEHFQYTDENGKAYSYLFAIDPFLWYGYGESYLECGSHGCYVDEFGVTKNLRNGRYGEIRTVPYITLMGVWIYKFFNFLPFSSIPLMHAFFNIQALMMALAVIPAFFLGKKLGGNVGGFFTAMLISINAAVLSRTPSGFADTDFASVLFPLLLGWFLIEAFSTKNWKKISLYSVLAGITFYIFDKFWITTPTFGFMLGAVGLYGIYKIVVNIVKNSNFDVKSIWKDIDYDVYRSLSFLGVSLIFLVISNGLGYIKNIIMQPLSFAVLHDVGGIKIWPNVMTTVAELKTVPLINIIGQLGGNVLVFIAIVGLILSIFTKDEKGNKNLLFSIFLLIWFAGTIFAFTRGLRFGMFAIPPFAIAVGTGIGLVYRNLGDWMSKEFNINRVLSYGILLFLALLLLVSPLQVAGETAKVRFPSYNTAWDNTLNLIKEDAEDGYGYVTTWWDFGHWFVAKGIRVTFDGGGQGERIHWVGKAFLTEDEDLSAGIIRMLNCGQENAPHILECALSDGTWIWEDEPHGIGNCNLTPTNENLIKAIDLIDEVVVLDRESAHNKLSEQGISEENINLFLKHSHCEDTFPQYVIASEDMVAKSGVWGHFGSWDFRRALMYQNIRGSNYSNGMNILKNNFSLNEDLASRYYNEIQTTPADNWVSAWPSYVGGKNRCTTVSSDELLCTINVGQQIPIHVDLKTYSSEIRAQDRILHPDSIVYVDGNDVVKKEFDKNLIGFSIILISEGNSYYVQAAQPKQAYSMFTRLFFFGGHGLTHFKPFNVDVQITGDKIITYKVDWDSEDKFDLYFKEQVRASHILISTNERSDEEALEIIESLKVKLTSDNFADLAEEYSDCPSSVNGGSLGWFERGRMVKPFEDEAFSLKTGQISDVVETQFGYHLIYLEDKNY